MAKIDIDIIKKENRQNAQYSEWVNSALGKVTQKAFDIYNSKNPNFGIIDSKGCVYTEDKECLLEMTPTLKYCNVKEGTKVICSNNIGTFKISIDSTINKRLQCLKIPSSVWCILKDSFLLCRDLTFVSFGSGLKVIGKGAFHLCNLQQVYIPDGVEYIGDRAFASNPLKAVFLPKSINFIHYKAFHNCNNLTIYVPATLKKKFSTMLFFDTDKIIETGYDTWEEEATVKAFKKATVVKKQVRKWASYDDWKRYQDYLDYRAYREDYSEEAIWDAMTDGMYGDYPDEGYDGDYEFMGY